MSVARNIFILLSCIFFGYILSACSTEVEYQSPSEQIVVEGWIEDGEAPVVILSQLLPIGVVLDSFYLWNVPIRWANVTVNDGQQDYVLTGRPDKRYFVGYTYSTNELKGEVGKEYTLRVSYEGRMLTSSTRIPAPVALSDLRVRPHSSIDSLCQISASILDPANEHNYYLIRVRQGNDVFCPAMGGIFEDALLTTPQTRIPIYKPVKISNIKSKPNKTPFFTRSESVEVRLCNIQLSAFQFWVRFMNVAINASNPIYPSVQNLQGNIQGGLGIWYGAGINTAYLNVPDSLLQQNP